MTSTPPAMFEEGGEGASVKYVDSSDNRGAGSSMGNQIEELGLDDGEKVRLVVMNDGDDTDGDDTDDSRGGDGGS